MGNGSLLLPFTIWKEVRVRTHWARRSLFGGHRTMRYTTVLEMLKVNECDFCESKSEHLYPINDGFWAICKTCYDYEYGECHPPEYCVNKSCECEEE